MKLSFPPSEIIIFFFFEFIISHKTIVHKIAELEGTYAITLPIGNQNITTYFTIDLSFPYSYYTFLSSEKALTKNQIKEEILNIENQTVSASLINESMYLSSDLIQLNGYLFYVLSSNGLKKKNSLSFAHFPKNDSFSLIHSLYNQKLIDNLQFGFSFKQEKFFNEGKIFFGGLPDYILESNPFNVSCKVNSINNSRNYWGCKLEAIYFSLNNLGYTYLPSTPSFFQTNQYKILVPVSFLDFLNNHIFSIYIEKKICVFADYGENPRFKCKCDNYIQETFPILKFKFEEVIFDLDFKTLFLQKSDSCAFLIEGNSFQDNFWIFGTGFLSNYIELFDYKKDEITFYNSKPFSVFRKKENKNENIQNFNNKSLLIFLIFILLIFIIFLIIIRAYNK